MNILSSVRYKQHFEYRKSGKGPLIYELLLPTLLFASIGAITWAIRGTAGWGGVDGTVVPGLTWGLLWYYLAYRRGIDARGIVLWLGLGLALGGELGYGQYTGWIQGVFQVGNETIHISPLLGYFWFTMCGIGWAAPGGILLGWALSKSTSVRIWTVRSLILLLLLAVLFVPSVIDYLGDILLKTESSILYPNADKGIYAGNLGDHLSRTVYTNTQNFVVVIWWIVSLLAAIWQRDKVTIVLGLIIGGGFGLGFMQSAIWVLGYGIAPDYIDWWKVWELNSGFNLGVLYAIAFYWAIRNLDKTTALTNNVKIKELEFLKFNKWIETLFLAIAGFVLLFFVGFEYFFWTGLALSIFYFCIICFTVVGDSESEDIIERRKKIVLIYSVFLLMFLLFHGGSERLGVIFELYSPDEVSQYSWPINRVLLFAPVAIVIVMVTLFSIRKALRTNVDRREVNCIDSKLTMRIIDLLMIIGFIGVLSIWPAKISIFYALFLGLSVFAVNRIENVFNKLDNNLK